MNGRVLTFVIWCGLSIALAQGADAQLLVKRGNYGTRQACESAKLLSVAECRNAFDNALAELEEKAPRFKVQGECEKHFRRCAGATGGRARDVAFVPELKGVEVVTRFGYDRIATPVIENKTGVIQFAPRNVTRRDSSRSPQKQAQAQKAWESSVIVVRGAVGGDQADEAFPDAVPPLDEKQAPVRAPTPEEMERHRQRLRQAPLVR